MHPRENPGYACDAEKSGKMLYLAVLKCTMFTVHFLMQNDIEPYGSPAGHHKQSSVAIESPLFVV